MCTLYPQAAGQRGSVQDAEARAEAREPRPGGHGPEDEAAPAGARGRGHGALHPPGPHTPPPLHQDRGHPAPAPSQGEQCCCGAQSVQNATVDRIFIFRTRQKRVFLRFWHLQFKKLKTKCWIKWQKSWMKSAMIFSRKMIKTIYISNCGSRLWTGIKFLDDFVTYCSLRYHLSGPGARWRWQVTTNRNSATFSGSPTPRTHHWNH